MSTITIGRVPVGSAERPQIARPGFWRRAFDRFVEAQLRKADEQIRRYHRFAWPRELEQTNETINDGRDSLPFGP
jgi:hypothetical protein